MSYHVKEEEKQVLDKEMERLCHLGTLQEGFSAHCSQVMLISRKITNEKRCVFDCRHILTRITETNLDLPL